MAQAKTIQVGQRFPVGTTVAAYRASNWSVAQIPPSGAPAGSADVSGVVVAADTTATFAGLADGVEYFITNTSGTAGSMGYIRFVTASAGSDPAPTANVGAQVTAPTAAQVIADTGALSAGDYRIEIEGGAADTLAAGKGIRIEHRNAANTGNTRQSVVIPAGASATLKWQRVTVAEGERIRATAGGVAGAASSEYGATIRAYRLG